MPNLAAEMCYKIEVFWPYNRYCWAKPSIMVFAQQ